MLLLFCQFILSHASGGFLLQFGYDFLVMSHDSHKPFVTRVFDESHNYCYCS